MYTGKFVITAFSHFGDPVNEGPLLSALLGVSGDDWTKTVAQFHLARTHVVHAIAVILLRIDDLMTC